PERPVRRGGGPVRTAGARRAAGAAVARAPRTGPAAGGGHRPLERAAGAAAQFRAAGRRGRGRVVPPGPHRLPPGRARRRHPHPRAGTRGGVFALTRLSDLLFVLARVYNRDGREDVLWVPGKTVDGGR